MTATRRLAAILAADVARSPYRLPPTDMPATGELATRSKPIIFTTSLAVGQVMFKRAGLAIRGQTLVDGFLSVLVQPAFYIGLVLYGFLTEGSAGITAEERIAFRMGIII